MFQGSPLLLGRRAREGGKGSAGRDLSLIIVSLTSSACLRLDWPVTSAGQAFETEESSPLIEIGPLFLTADTQDLKTFLLSKSLPLNLNS